MFLQYLKDAFAHFKGILAAFKTKSSVQAHACPCGPAEVLMRARLSSSESDSDSRTDVTQQGRGPPSFVLRPVLLQGAQGHEVWHDSTDIR